MLGYWGGISPENSIAKKYQTREVRIDNKDGVLINHARVVEAEDIPKIYDDFYKFLLESGVDAIKTDAQPLFHTQLPNNKPRFMVRKSDNFFPGKPDPHTFQVFVSPHNSVYTSHLFTLPDWDMFQAVHPYASCHGTARCLSGGPIYMAARTTHDQTIILRPSVGKSSNVYTAYEEERLLKIHTLAGPTGVSTSLLGLFNVSQRPPFGALPGLHDLRVLNGANIVSIISNGQMTTRSQHCRQQRPGDPLCLSLATSLHLPFPSLIPTRVPVQYPRHELGCLGPTGQDDRSRGRPPLLHDLPSQRSHSDPSHTQSTRYPRNLRVRGRRGGTFGARRSDGFLERKAGACEYHPIEESGSDGQGRAQIEVDLERAWKEMGMEAGRSDGVEVQIFV
ncbi:hypothetical protein MMC28_007770 [Mycoblastus sanguinarius]|nr:hypothetical protein [Mycoblastus sanguinarius]